MYMAQFFPSSLLPQFPLPEISAGGNNTAFLYFSAKYVQTRFHWLLPAHTIPVHFYLLHATKQNNVSKIILEKIVHSVIAQSQEISDKTQHTDIMLFLKIPYHTFL